MTNAWMPIGVALALGACGPEPSVAPPVTMPDPQPPVVRPAVVDARLVERAPAVLASLRLPMGATVAVPWVGAEGNGVLVTRDARFLGVDAYGEVAEVERLPGEPRGMDEAPAVGVVERSPGEPIALVPSGGLVLRDGWVRRAELPPLLRNARGMVRWGQEVLWWTSAGLYTTLGERWYRLDRAAGPVTDVAELVPGAVGPSAREVWVRRAGGELERLQVETTAMGPRAVWSDPVPGLALGRVRSIARLGDERYIARELDLLRVDARGALARIRVPGEFSGPIAMVTAGPWIWMAWESGELGRLNGDRVELLARGLTQTKAASGTLLEARIAADPVRGDAVLAILTVELPGEDPMRRPRETRVLRLVVEPVVTMLGFAPGTVVTEPRLNLLVQPPLPGAVEAVQFRLDDAELATVSSPPFGWGVAGRPSRDFPALDFGAHEVEVVVRYRGAPELRRTRSFRYLSPLGRVPTYDRDIAPVYAARCARCHSTGVARDLRGYERLSAQASLVAMVISSRRMPPDLELDAPTMQLFTAWVAGSTPR